MITENQYQALSEELNGIENSLIDIRRQANNTHQDRVLESLTLQVDKLTSCVQLLARALRPG